MDANSWIALVGIGATLLMAVIGYQWRLSQRVTKAETLLVPGIGEKIGNLEAGVGGLKREIERERADTKQEIAEIHKALADSERRTERAIDAMTVGMERVHDRLDTLITYVTAKPPTTRRRKLPE